MKNKPFQISRRDIVKYSGIGLLGAIVTHKATQHVLENQVETIQEPSTEDEFPFTLAGMFLDSIQEEKKIPRENHDMRLDFIITEKEVLSNFNLKII